MKPFTPHPRLAFGLVLILIGALLLSDRLELIDIGPLWRYWPLLLTIIGLAQAIGGRARDIYDGLWLAATGAWLYVSLEHIWGLSFATSWPFWLIAWGVSHIAKPYLIPNAMKGKP